MDKKKVKELIEHSILHIDRVKMVNIKGFEALIDTKRMLESALEELSKSDWISVEEKLPPYEEVVNVIMKDFVKTEYTCTSRCPVYNKMRLFNYDENSFEVLIPMQHVTHWKPIEKVGGVILINY